MYVESGQRLVSVCMESHRRGKMIADGCGGFAGANDYLCL